MPGSLPSDQISRIGRPDSNCRVRTRAATALCSIEAGSRSTTATVAVAGAAMVCCSTRTACPTAVADAAASDCRETVSGQMRTTAVSEDPIAAEARIAAAAAGSRATRCAGTIRSISWVTAVARSDSPTTNTREIDELIGTTDVLGIGAQYSSRSTESAHSGAVATVGS